jgi:murein DD-endopeptidase MepM/ murein hydrolase activator NlpD
MFMHPVPGPITVRYGPRPRFGFHNGLDHGWLEDDPETSQRVFALADGVVENLGWNALVGYYLLIRINSRIVVRQAHFPKRGIVVVVGQCLVQGVTFIGRMGNTGTQVDGIHLHTDVFLDGVRVDPEPYFTIPFGQTAPKTVRKKNMPLNIVKQSTLNSAGGVVFGKSEYATLGEPVNPVMLYTRTEANDIAPALSAAYGPHTPVSDKAWADLVARYTVAVPAAGGFTSADRSRLNAVPTAEQNGAAARTAIVK